jgi:polysaccharide pyruvyl transferase WcaK-like protein
MTKVLLYGVMSENNLGGPSLMHGVREIMKSLHNDYEIVCYQNTKVIDTAVCDMGFPVYEIPYKRNLSMMIDGVKCKAGIAPKQAERGAFLEHLKTSDIVANLVGICFCSNFDTGEYSYLKSIKRVLTLFSIGFLAKMYERKSVKCTSSYGPIVSKNDLVAARFAGRHIFDVMCAREVESERQMREIAGIMTPIKISPDMANLMPYTPGGKKLKKLVGISVSHQVIRQWKAGETYICCVSNLIRHILKMTLGKVLLIPNEIPSYSEYHDAHVATEIWKELDCNSNVSVLDVSQMSSTQLKTEIGQCEVLVASRYHSCVAALSSGIPTLVVGWHHKYYELLKLYDQEQWIISSEDCTTSELIRKFDELWDGRIRERAKIIAKYEEVRKKVMEAGKLMFMKQNG